MNKRKNVQSVLTEHMTPTLFNKLASERDTFVIGVPREYVERMEMSYIESWVETLRTCEKAKSCRFIINIHGYDNDRRELYQIPEVCKFIEKVFTDFAELYYFLDEYQSIWIRIIISASEPPHLRPTGRVAADPMRDLAFRLYVNEKLPNIKYLTQSEIMEYVRKHM